MSDETQSAEALVVTTVEFGESDKVVRLVTPTGRRTVFAPAAKKSRRRFAGALEPFTLLRIECATGRKSKAGMPVLVSATVVKSRLALRRDLQILALASVLVELVEGVVPEGAPCEGVYDLLDEALDRLETLPASIAFRRCFELRLMAELGYHPWLERCVECGRQDGRVFLSLIRGGRFCETHRMSGKEIGPKTIAWMQGALMSELFDPTGTHPEAWAERAAQSVASELDSFFENLLGRPLKTVGWLESLQ